MDNYCECLSQLKLGRHLTQLTQTGIRSLPNVTGRDFTGFNNLAVLRYAGAADTNPIVPNVTNPSGYPTVNIPAGQLPLLETNLHVGGIMIITL